jgi:hypothetical protein
MFLSQGTVDFGFHMLGSVHVACILEMLENVLNPALTHIHKVGNFLHG